MRGYPDLNYLAFREAAHRFRCLGHVVVSPAEVGDELGDGHAPQDYLRADLVAMLRCDGIAVLPGWEKSTGARVEAAVAVTLGFPFYDEKANSIASPAEIIIRGGYERPAE